MDNKHEAEVALVKQESETLVSDLIKTFPDTEIMDDTDLARASEALTSIAQHVRLWEAKRVAIVKPANDFVRSINDLWKRILAPVQTEESRIRTLMGRYRAAEQARRQAEYEASLVQSREIFPEGSPIPETVAPIPHEPIQRVHTEQGTVGFTTVHKWAVEDEAKIPQEYWLLDSAKITKVVKAGVRSIPGIRIYSEQVPTVRRS